MQFFLRKKSFTLIEMLIVIVIIGILAAALVPRLQDVQARARDTKRKADIKVIANWLEIYFIDNNSFPGAGTSNYNNVLSVNSVQSQPRITGLTNYLTSLPVDPRNNWASPWTTWSYSYTYGWVYNTSVWTYDLVTNLENTSDPDACWVKQYKYNNNGSLFCPNSSYERRKTIYNYSPNVSE